ncbi:hypothetical protein D3C76_1370950 [compost metagenome]
MQFGHAGLRHQLPGLAQGLLGHRQEALGDLVGRGQALFAVIEGFVGQAPGHRFAAIKAVAQQQQARRACLAQSAW